MLSFFAKTSLFHLLGQDSSGSSSQGFGDISEISFDFSDCFDEQGRVTAECAEFLGEDPPIESDIVEETGECTGELDPFTGECVVVEQPDDLPDDSSDNDGSIRGADTSLNGRNNTDFLFVEPKVDIKPELAFLLNEVVGAVAIALVGAHQLFLYRGQFDTFLFAANSILWGQNQLMWIISRTIDTEGTRKWYLRSTKGVLVLPWVVMPIFLVWLLFHHAYDINGEYNWYLVLLKYTSFFAYSYLVRQYLKLIQPSLYNYWMQPVAARLQRLIDEEAEFRAFEEEEMQRQNNGTSSEQEQQAVVTA